MCLCRMPLQPRLHGRRAFLHGTAATVVAAPLLAGCDAEDWSFNLVPESQVLAMSAQSWAQLRASVPQSQDTQRRQTVQSIAETLITANGLGSTLWQVELF